MRNIVTPIMVGIIIFCPVFVLGYDWPLQPFNQQHQINSTFGEYRSGHFHQGVDIKAFGSDTTSNFYRAYSILSDTAYRTNGANPGVRVGKYYYIHLKNRVNDNTYVTAFQDTIGRIQPSENHLHFHWTSRYPPLSDTVFNPLWTGALTPYVDSTNLHIDSIKFYRQGPGDTLLHKDTLDRKVDVLAVARDTRTDSTGHVPAVPGTTSVYRIGYVVKDTSGNIKKTYWEKIKFDTIPNPSSSSQLNLTYGSGSSSSHFRYWVSNDPFNSNSDLRNWYWNTKQQTGQPDSVDADSIEVAKFKDGYYWVKIYAYDIKNNADSESVYVHVDNFNPRIKEKRPNDWFAFVPTHEKRVWCRFSEQMDTTTFNSTNIKIRSLKSDSFNYPITNITYIDSIYKLYIEVDSFRFKDTVQDIKKPGDTLRCRHDSLRTRLRLQTRFAEGNFLNYKILNINTKINRAFFEKNCTLDKYYIASIIIKEKRRYEGLAEVCTSGGLDTFYYL